MCNIERSELRVGIHFIFHALQFLRYCSYERNRQANCKLIPSHTLYSFAVTPAL